MWIKLVEEIETDYIKLRMNSRLVISQIRGEAQSKDSLSQQYLKLAKGKLAKFKAFVLVTFPEKKILKLTCYVDWPTLGV